VRPRLLDLFCGGGGAGEGYRRAGFDVVGVDVKRRACGYPAGTFIKADALDVLADAAYLRTFDAIHASPPCQANTRAQHLRDAQGKTTSKVDLIPQTRAALDAAGVPYVIENVPGAPMRADLILCGSMFGLAVRRHRLFESTVPMWLPGPCRHGEQGRPVGVYGSKADDIPQGGRTARTLEEGQAAMGIGWMSWAALIEAIPPAYTEWLGLQIIDALGAAA
jgi:DNA (cytosine-5)-methyltransferase 1